MTTDAEIIASTEDPSERSAPDYAPDPWVLVAAVLAASFCMTLVNMAIEHTTKTDTFQTAYRFSILDIGWLVMQAAMIAIPAIVAVLMTRRSAMPITVAAAALVTILLPKMDMYGLPWILGVAVMALFVWLACTRSPIKSTDKRRGPGEPMNRKIPGRVVKICLISFVLIAIAMIAFMGSMGALLVLMIIPICYKVALGWFAAVVCDGFGTKNERNAIDKSTPAT